MTNPTIISHFSIDRLLINGFIADRGQLSTAQRSELERRVAKGELVKVLYQMEPNKAPIWCWKVAKQ